MVLQVCNKSESLVSIYNVFNPCYMLGKEKIPESSSKKGRRRTLDGDCNKLMCDHDVLSGFGYKTLSLSWIYYRKQ